VEANRAAHEQAAEVQRAQEQQQRASSPSIWTVVIN